MVISMNKTEFIEELSKKINYSIEDCTRINSILEDNFLFGKNNKIKTITALMNNLNIDEEEGNRIYDITRSIISKAIKNKIKHPFR